MNHKDLPPDLAGGFAGGQSGEVVLHGAVVFPPGVLVVEHRGIIPLATAGDGVFHQVLAAPRNAHDELPVAQPLLALEIELPAGATVGFGNHHLPPVLMRRAGGLLDSQVFPGLLSQQIDARGVEVSILGHGRATDPYVVTQVVFIEHVSRQPQAVGLAPVVHVLQAPLAEQFRQRSPEVVPQPGAALHVEEQAKQPPGGVVPPALPELFRQVACPRQPRPPRRECAEEIVEVGLVGEEALDLLVDIIAKEGFIALVGQLNKTLHGLDAQTVGGHMTVVPFTGPGDLLAQD